MNKAELINAVAGSTGQSKTVVGDIIDVAIAAIRDALKSGETVKLMGFGSFEVRNRKGRTGRDPRNGAPMEIKERKNAKFRAGKELRDALNT